MSVFIPESRLVNSNAIALHSLSSFIFLSYALARCLLSFHILHCRPMVISPNTTSTSTMRRDIDKKFQKALSALWRAGLYKDISLTAIVVCGDQSSGKSAVLEAISGFRFPVNDGMCTRFLTRVEMEQDNIVRLKATVVPSAHHSIQKQEELGRWQYETVDLAEFSQVVLRAGEVMGSGSEKGFLKDQLIIRILGPELPVFVFIDLPGLIQSTREGQLDTDVEYIKELMIDHMKDPTKIVLTVVAANNDLELQGVLRQARQIDPSGERTIGVITKPDACEDRPSIQQAALNLLENTGNGLYQWLLGWHIVKNRSDSQRDMTTAQRDATEREYLAQPPWDKVPDQFKGAENLSTRLEARVFETFTSSIPSLKAQIQDKAQEARLELDWVTSNVSSMLSLRTNLRTYLDTIEREMNKRLDKASQDTRDIFGARLEDLAADLVNVVRSHGHFYEFDEKCLVEQPRPPTAALQAQWDLPEPRPACELQTVAESIVANAGVDAGQMTEAMYKELFRKQASHWHHILRQYLNLLKDLFDTQLSEVSSQIVPTEIKTVFNDVVVSTQVDIFADQLRTQIDELPVPGKLRGRQATEAASKAWKAQYDVAEEQRLKEAFGIADNKSTSTGQNMKRDFQTVLQGLRRLEVDVVGFPARQAIAVMQLLYISRTDDVRPLCDEKAILRAMRGFLTGWAERVMLSVSDEQLKLIFDTNCIEGEDVTKWREKIELYNQCLVVLNDL